LVKEGVRLSYKAPVDGTNEWDGNTDAFSQFGWDSKRSYGDIAACYQRWVNSYKDPVNEKLQKRYEGDQESNSQNIQSSWEGV
jgi:hypothetical protein